MLSSHVFGFWFHFDLRYHLISQTAFGSDVFGSGSHIFYVNPRLNNLKLSQNRPSTQLPVKECYHSIIAASLQKEHHLDTITIDSIEKEREKRMPTPIIFQLAIAVSAVSTPPTWSSNEPSGPTVAIALEGPSCNTLRRLPATRAANGFAKAVEREVKKAHWRPDGKRWEQTYLRKAGVLSS